MLKAKDDVSVPTCVTGVVQRTQIDYCQDGIPYLIVTQAGTFRVHPGNSEVAEVLEGAAGTRMLVAVCGYLRSGVECAFLDTYWAGHPQKLEALA